MARSKKIFSRRNDTSEMEKKIPLLSRPKAHSSLRLDKIFPPASPLRPKDTRSIETVLVQNARVPSVFWSAGWLLREIEDVCWLTITEDSFPRRLRPDHKGHPGYVLEEIGNYALRLCPCSSLPQSSPYIPQGTVLQPTAFIISSDSYVVEKCSSVIPRDDTTFSKIPKFLGVFPPEKLQR